MPVQKSGIENGREWERMPTDGEHGGERSAPILDAWPERLQVPLQAAAEQNRACLVSIGVRNVQSCGDFDGGELLARIRFRHADQNDHLTGVVARPPEKIILMATDGFRQAVARSEKVNGAGLAVVVAKNGGFGLLFRRQRVIDAGERGDLPLPG